MALATATALVSTAAGFANAADLSPDASFGTSGSVSFAVMDGATALRIAGIGHIVHADGAMLVATSHTVSGVPVLALRRLRRDGSLDTGFGTAGVRRHDLPACGSAATPIVAQAAPGDRSLISIGTCTVRLLADGTIDSSYGTGGLVSDALNEFPQFLRVDSQGRALNFRRNSSVSAFEVTRLTDTGAFDPSFGSDASGVGRIVTGSGNWFTWDAFLQADDKPVMIAVSGAMQGAGRWTLAGLPDAVFGSSGMATVACPAGSSFCDVTGGVARADGKLTLALVSSIGGVSRLGAAVIDEHAAQASPAQTFVIDALPTLGADAAGSDIRTVALGSDRSALVLKTSAAGGSTADIVVLCLRGDATLDPQCGAGGYRVLDTVVNGIARGSEFPRWVSYDGSSMAISAITTIGQDQFATIWRLGFDRVFADGYEEP